MPKPQREQALVFAQLAARVQVLVLVLVFAQLAARVLAQLA